MTGKHRLKSAFLGLGGIGLGLAGLALTDLGAPSAKAAVAQRRADPGSLVTVLRDARGGEQVVLAAGDYGDVRFPSRLYSPALRIDARAAHFTKLMIQGAGGVVVTGGTVDGPRSQSAAVVVDMSRNVELHGMRTTGSQVGISVSRSQHVVLADNVFDAMASDGVNIAGSQDVRVEHNACRDFRPTIGTYDSRGKPLKDGNHPDCIQGWSIRGRPPLADIAIIGNTAHGIMQGVYFGNPGQGGIDGIVVRDNTLDVALFNGILILDAHNARVSHNVVRTIPGSRLPNYPFKQVTAWIRVRPGDANGNTVCGNVVDVPRFSDGQGPCRDGKL